jgi:prevent-host-death family protein
MYMFMYITAMPQKYSIASARMSLASIVNKAEAGAAVEITRRGKSVAVVLSVQTFERMQGGGTRFGDAYRKFLRKYSPEEIGLEEDFAASARGKGEGRRVRL